MTIAVESESRVMQLMKILLQISSTTISAFLITGFLAGCHSSTAKFRDYSYDVAFDIDGEVYRVSLDYRCYLEDTTKFSERGEGWHIRGRPGVRVLGRLHDGSRFEALPKAEMGRDVLAGASCPDSTRNVPSNILVEDRNDISRVDEFDGERTTSALHKVLIIRSEFVLKGSGTDRFIPAAEQPESPGAVKEYYTIVLGSYPRRRFMICEPDLVNIINQHKIPWLVPDTAYPIAPRIPNGEDFVGKCGASFSVFIDGAEELALAPNDAAGAWVLAESDRARGWLAASREPNAWIRYGHARIEAPTENTDLAFYEPSEDRIIAFYRQSFRLW